MTHRIWIAILSLAAIAACSRSPGPAALPPEADNALLLQRTAVAYKTIYDFKGIPDGASPNGDLAYSNGALYGSSYYGGVYGAGTVFRVTASGEERVVHYFHVFDSHAKQANAYPLGIALLQGVLYGTTVHGGAYSDQGTAFAMTTAGRERIIHSFGYGSDARVPYSGLLASKGTLYGEAGGGTYGCGTVFSVTPAAQERVVYNFNGDQCAPTGGLTAVNGTFYGTTLNGGPYSDGTVFSLTTSGTFNVLHTFSPGGDGTSPNGGVIAYHGTLYGTTTAGGKDGGGTVFSLNKSGNEQILHDFGSGTDGSSPNGRLTVRDGVLYGTTESGGMFGGGTVFSMTTSGTEEILHNFGSGSDGAEPAGALLLLKGSLYGTTVAGGNVCNGAGCGTVFELTP
jgi:uncharacterized repeat protein (TIGR03803 family)